ncbi:DUF1624 domain-containing protein [Ottowia sp.]|uniref:DUF1624 domain-containing protein n=1 Tax=Ottowia sp. TaxID=1898956 RepID=UPI0025EB966E|nr:heparan-alpha-glucosaminide N-acetyltransferase [Ottowia sp.]MBK6748078.1 DUF1624 domain-containing protein [Ottowia sp.]
MGWIISAARHDRLDALRGLAMVWMTAYHFCFDLNHFGHIRQDFYGDPFWTWQRTAIVSLFLFTAGASQALAVRGAQGWPRFWRRWAQVAGCALLVSLGSWWMFPRSWISFGVLHGLAAMLLIARGLLAVGLLRAAVPWVLGAALVAGAPWLGEWLGTRPLHVAALFDSRWLNWIGVVTHKPITEDYVPLLPWLGVLLLGVGAGQALPPVVLAPPVGALRRKLAVLGRWSLSYYMLHQPVLIGALMAWGAVRG